MKIPFFLKVIEVYKPTPTAPPLTAGEQIFTTVGIRLT
jgi:hypothetical protein